MFDSKKYTGIKDEDYSILIRQTHALIENENDIIANLSNISALLNGFYKDINWVGFYLLKNNELVLGPFQGKPACTRIQIGKGVCGTAIMENKTMIVNNVHEFSGHIACDSDSNSEIVVCLYSNNKIVGVLDIDSPIFSRFDENDAEMLEILAENLSCIFEKN